MARSTPSSSDDDDLAASLLSNPPTRRKVQCHTCLLLTRLQQERPEAAKALEQALEMPIEQYPATAIVRRLSQFGYELSISSVQKHRRGECRCRQNAMN